MGCQHSTPIPQSHDFDYHLPRPPICLSETVKPPMFPGQSLDLQFGVIHGHPPPPPPEEENQDPRRHHRRPPTSSNHTQTRILANDTNGNHLIGTIHLEEKEMDGVVIHTKLVLRDSKGKLTAILKHNHVHGSEGGGVSGVLQDCYEIYSLRPRHVLQTPSWAYHDLPLYSWGRVVAVPGSSLQYQLQIVASNATTTTTTAASDEEWEEVYRTHEVGSRLTRYRKMAIRNGSNDSSSSATTTSSLTRAFAVQQDTTPSRILVKGNGRRPTQEYVPSCSMWRCAVGPSTDPFLMIAFVVGLEQLRTAPTTSSPLSLLSQSTSCCGASAEDQIIR
jgi:hypothetical protein